MILTLMLIILTATLVIVITGFVMDRMAVTKLKSGMRTLNKRIKRLERVKLTIADPSDITLELTEKGREYLAQMDREDVTYEAVDLQTDSETETTDGGDILAETDDEIQNTGD